MSSRHLAGIAVIVLLLGALADLRADDESEQTVSSREHTKLLHQIREIVIERLVLDQVTPKEALRILSDEIIKADPAHRGISFVGHFTDQDVYAKITLKLENVSVKEALRQLFQYSVGDSVVYVAHDWGEGLDSRVFSLPNGLYVLGPNAPGEARKQTYDVLKQFAAKGVRFAPGATATYQPEKKELTVVGTDDEINQVDEILNL